MLDLLVDVLLDAVIDTLKLLPFLFVTYLAMEALESAAGLRATRVVERAGRLGPVLGALLGAVPQCGFSAAAATLYAGRVITVGTLLAVFLSTGDELLPVFLSEGADVGQLLRILAVKATLAVVVGLVADALLHLLHRAGDGHIHVHELCEREGCGCDGEGAADEAADGRKVAQDGALHACTGERGEVVPAEARARCDDDARAHGSRADHDHADHDAHAGHDHAGHAHTHGGGILRGVVMGATHHTLQVTLFIFLVTLAINLVIGIVGEDALGAFMAGNPVVSVLAAGVVGLIPNCAASVVVAELFLEGTIGSAALLAGSLVSAGIGLLVLFRTNAGIRHNLLIAAALWAVGVACGLVMLATGLEF